MNTYMYKTTDIIKIYKDKYPNRIEDCSYGEYIDNWSNYGWKIIGKATSYVCGCPVTHGIIKITEEDKIKARKHFEECMKPKEKSWTEQAEEQLKEKLRADAEYMFSKTHDALMEHLNKYKQSNNMETKKEEIARRTGRTTRLVDSYIQELFTKGSIEVKDNTCNPDVAKQFNKELFDLISNRLEREHPHVKLDRRLGYIRLKEFYKDGCMGGFDLDKANQYIKENIQHTNKELSLEQKLQLRTQAMNIAATRTEIGMDAKIITIKAEEIYQWLIKEL